MAALVLLAAVAAGCGGSSDSSASLTKAEFVKKGDAICKRFEQERLSAIKAFVLVHKGKLGPTATQEDLVEEAALPPIRAGVEKLAELGTPKTDADKATKFVEAYEEAVSHIGENASVALNGDPFAKVRKASSGFGFKNCGQI